MSSSSNYRLEVLKNTLYSSFGLYGEFIIGMLTMLIMARTLGPEEYGSYALAIWCINLFRVIACGGVNQSLIKFVAEMRGAENPPAMVGVYELLRSTLNRVTAVVMLGALALLVFASDSLFPPAMQLALFGGWLALLARIYYMFRLSLAKGAERFGVVAAVPLISSPLHLLLVGITSIYFPTVQAFLISFLLASCVFFLSSWILTRNIIPDDVPADLDPPNRRRVIRHMLLASATMILGFLMMGNTEILMLGMFDERESVAYFQVATRLAEALRQLAPSAMAAVLLPVLARTMGQAPDAVARRFLGSIRFVLLVGMPVSICAAVFAPEAIDLLYGAEYAESVFPFAVLVIASMFGAVYFNANTLLVSLDRQGLVLILLAIIGVIKFALAAYLTFTYGLNGALISASFSRVVFPLIVLGIALRIIHTKPQLLVYFKITLASLLAVLPCLPIALKFDNIFAAGLGAFIYFAAYCVLLWRTRWLPPEDYRVIGEATAKLKERYLPAR